jgi:thiamine pyrophosphokinase
VTDGELAILEALLRIERQLSFLTKVDTGVDHLLYQDTELLKASAPKYMTGCGVSFQPIQELP